MQSLLVEIPEEMAVRRETKAEIAQEVTSQLAAAIEGLRPRGWGKAIAALRQLGPLVAIIGVFVALFGITLGALYQAFSHVREETAFRTNANDRLKDIEQDEKDIKAGLTKQSLANHATLPLSDFESTLPELKSSIQIARKENVRVPSNVMDGLQQKLLKVSTNVPEFWQTASEFITYRSQMALGWRETNMPTCDDQFHHFKVSFKEGSPVITHGPVEIQDCKIVLDSPSTAANLSQDLSLADIVFKHCAVFYSGGLIVLIPVIVAPGSPAILRGQLTFEECLFIVSLPGAPQGNGEEFTRSLLSSQGGTLTLALQKMPTPPKDTS